MLLTGLSLYLIVVVMTEESIINGDTEKNNDNSLMRLSFLNK